MPFRQKPVPIRQGTGYSDKNYEILTNTIYSDKIWYYISYSDSMGTASDENIDIPTNSDKFKTFWQNMCDSMVQFWRRMAVLRGASMINRGNIWLLNGEAPYHDTRTTKTTWSTALHNHNTKQLTLPTTRKWVYHQHCSITLYNTCYTQTCLCTINPTTYFFTLPSTLLKRPINLI